MLSGVSPWASIPLGRPRAQAQRVRQPDNFAVFRAKKNNLRLEVRLPLSDETTKKLEAAGVDLMDYDNRWGRYRILGEAKTVRALLSNRKYSIDYYQREYKWEEKQIHELVDDLTGKFLEDHEPTHERGAVETYGHYFLGSIVISHRDNRNFVIDGQQRLTSLTLLLIYLHNLQKGSASAVKIDDLIYSERYAKKSFNIDVDERAKCMEALYDGQAFDPADQPESVQRIVARYEDIEEQFPKQLKGESLPFFVDWLVDNVHLVEITAYSDEDAYTIFETMNDRGLSLTPTEMLKGFLLANIADPTKRNAANQLWKDRVRDLPRHPPRPPAVEFSGD